MTHDPCPVCNETETTINEIDQSICCINCGTVLEAITLQQFHEVEQVVSRGKKEKQKQKLSGLKERWEKVSVYYDLAEDIRIEGTRAIDRHHGKLPYHSENFNEICLALACSLGKYLRPDWTYDDYISLYPEAVFRPIVIKYYHLFEGSEVGTYVWKGYSDNQIKFTLSQVYSCIIKQIFDQSDIIPDGFNLTQLVYYTKILLKLGSSQGINGGKKARQLISSVACICALYLRSIVLSDQQTIRKKRKCIITPSSQQKVKKVNSKKEKKDLFHIWNYVPFSKKIFGTPTIFRRNYNEYTSMLVACTKKMPWIEQPITRKDAFLHLGDILEAFGQEGDALPMMKLSLKEFAPFSYIKNRNEDFIIKAIIHKAKELNEQDIEEESPLIYDALLCLKENYKMEDMETWTVSQLRRAGETIKYRKMFPLRVDELKNMNLNRKEIDTDDMGDNELASYIPTPLI